MKIKLPFSLMALAAVFVGFLSSCATEATLGGDHNADMALDIAFPDNQGPGLYTWESEAIVFDDLKTYSKEHADNAGKGFEDFEFSNAEVESIQASNFNIGMDCADASRPWTTFSDLFSALRVFVVAEGQAPVLVAEAAAPYSNDYHVFQFLGNNTELKDLLLDGTVYRMRVEFDLLKEVQEGYGLAMEWKNRTTVLAEREGKWSFKGRKYE